MLLHVLTGLQFLVLPLMLSNALSWISANMGPSSALNDLPSPPTTWYLNIS